jgi:ABC-type transport system involved in cytochrome bd biosynthesis fused ATPase/permease subunit
LIPSKFRRDFIADTFRPISRPKRPLDRRRHSTATLGGLALPLEAITEKVALIGRTGSGKSYAALRHAACRQAQ